MNFLAHLYLSGDEPEVLAGNFMGDFVKGRLDDRFPPRIRRGIELHRQIDSFALHNPHFRCSKERLAPSLGLYRGVMVDLFYDHFLAKNWDDHSAIPFGHYLSRAHAVMKARESMLPERLVSLLPAIFGELIPSYREVAGIERALVRMGSRVKRPNPLGAGGAELVCHYDFLEGDFRGFFTEVVAWVRSAGIVIDG